MNVTNGFARHHVVALALTAPLLVALAIDWVITGVTGTRTWVTDDAVGPAWVHVLVNALLAMACLALFLVLRAEGPRFASLGRLARGCRRVIMVGAVAMAVGNGVVYPVQQVVGLDEGPLYAASGLFAALALACLFLPALVLGVVELRRRDLGLGGRLLSLTIPALLLTGAVALVADDWASPVLLTMSVLGGLALVGARAGGPATP